MTNNSISERQPQLSPQLVKLAVSGSKDYHYLMTAIVHQSLMLKAGYIPDKLELPLPEKNPEHWQTKKSHMNAGNLWIFFATEYGHFSPKEAARIWRYGQVLLLRKKIVRQLVEMDCPPDVLNFADKALLNINDFIREPVTGEYEGLYRFSAWQADNYRTSVIKREIEPYSYDYDLMWLMDDLITDAGQFVSGRAKKYLDEAVKNFYEYVAQWRKAIALV